MLGFSDARVSPLPILYAVSNCTSTPELKINVAVLTLVFFFEYYVFLVLTLSKMIQFSTLDGTVTQKKGFEIIKSPLLGFPNIIIHIKPM